ncbi:HECT E3 ubiquitin ligase [Phytophthora cinnamomi]|uniref:HECT E3 ubiquitin ligase n=1 Tax=Phytophthora cinnamomi TaxID=4785 RepID=UPI00355A492F|nr:HECT E3 ubiquitin ligase [Phytophthora cinnamomi]
MGAQASREGAAAADAGPPDTQDERLAARAWRTGVPFTLLHDEGFVVEKFQELLAASSAPKLGGGKAREEAQTTVSGLDEAPMDELQHATDMARIKLFARARRDEGDQGGSRPGSPAASTAGASTLTSSAAKENPPSALARMVGNTLSRESPESVESEKLRAQRDELLQVYFEQVAARMKQKQTASEEETSREEEMAAAGTTEPSPVATPSAGLPVVAEGRKISQDVTPASIFSLGSLRLQLEMLREFRVLSPRLFEKGVMALVQSLLDSPPFALRDVGANTPEDALLNDVLRFCQDILHPDQGEQAATDAQRKVILILLLALGRMLVYKIACGTRTY